MGILLEVSFPLSLQSQTSSDPTTAGVTPAGTRPITFFLLPSSLHSLEATPPTKNATTTALGPGAHLKSRHRPCCSCRIIRSGTTGAFSLKL